MITVQICGEEYATWSEIIPFVHCGPEQLNNVNPRFETPGIFKQKKIFEFDRWFGQAEESFLLAASALLDVRFKKLHFTEPFLRF